MMKRSIILVGILMTFAFAANDVQAQTLNKYAQQKKQELLERQKVEQQKYENLCKDCTLDKCKEYLSLYPYGKYSEDVTNRMNDFELWNKVKSANTIESYQDYLSKSQYRFFASDANDAMAELKSVQEWERLKHTWSLADLQSFVNSYPKSSCASYASRRIHELKGVEYHKEGKLSEAYYEFMAAGGKYELEPSICDIFDECVEHHEYQLLKYNSDENKLREFMAKYPSSKYYDEVSNKVAIIKAKALNMYSGEYSFNNALSYAKDASTRATVNAYIENCKKSYANYMKGLHRSKIKANGGWLMFGVEPMDIGFNLMISDRRFNIGYYNVGISVKIGNYKSPVQFEVGAKPGIMVWKFNDDDYYEDNGTGTEFHLPIYARLKINLLNAGNKCKFYMAGLGFYNAVRDEYLENEISVGGGLGFAWHHWDWLMAYYRQSLDNKKELDDRFLGTSLIYYF